MDSILEQKSFQFAIRTVNLCKYLRSTKKEYTLCVELEKMLVSSIKTSKSN